MAESSNPAKSVVGVERLAMWKIVTDNKETLAYGEKYEFTDSLKAAGYVPNVLNASNYADNKQIESAAQKNGGTLDIEVSDFSAKAETMLFGSKVDGGVVVSNKNDVIPFVGVAFMQTFDDGTVDLYKFPKVKFTPQGKSASTITDGGLTYQSTKAQGKYMATLKNGDEMYLEKYANRESDKEKIEAWFAKAEFVGTNTQT